MLDSSDTCSQDTSQSLSDPDNESDAESESESDGSICTSSKQWTRGEAADYVGKTYLCAENSLRTIDWSKRIRLIKSFDCAAEKGNANITKLNEDDVSRSLLYSGVNLLSEDECNQIMETCRNEKLQDMKIQYKSGRNNSRLVIFDSLLADHLWKKLQPALEKQFAGYTLVPFGFDVLRGDWELSGINEAFRFNQYNCKRKEFFSAHRDSQFCPSGDERSVFSIVIYLNEGYSGGETVFYFPRDKTIDIKGLNINEEIDKNQGLDNGYEKVIITPKIGSCVIFTPNILHASLKVNENGKVENKCIIKTDIMMKRSGIKFGFQVCSDEEKDYFRCLQAFRDAQIHELQDQHEDACKLYETCLSIRYMYPSNEQLSQYENDPSLHQNEQTNSEASQSQNVSYSYLEENDSDKFDSSQESSVTNFSQQSFSANVFTKLTIEVWLHIMRYLDYIDVEHVVETFPHLYSCKRIINQSYIIPAVELRDGVFTKFTFKNYEFVRRNIAGCCRVLALYSVYLLGHSPENKTYTVRYNPERNEVTTIPLKHLLTSVFYEEPSYGSIFKVRQTDESKKDEKKDFFNSVDRFFMMLKYDKEYVGINVAEEFRCKISLPYNDSDDDDSYVDDFAVTTFKKDKRGTVYINGSNLDTLAGYDRLHELYKNFDNIYGNEGGKYDKNFESFKEYLTEATENIEWNDFDYKDFLYAGNRTASVGGAIVRKLRHKFESDGETYGCKCQIGDIVPSSPFSNALETITFNHMIFDFDRQKLRVQEENEVNTKKTNCCILPPYLIDRVKCSFLDVESEPNIFSKYKINIEEMCKDVSFNHAACQCLFPHFELDEYVNLQIYPHLDHVHALFLQNEKGIGEEEVTAWTCYGGIVCL